MKLDTDTLLKQFDPLIESFNNLKRQSQFEDFSDVAPDEVHHFISMCLSCIHRVAGVDSIYAQQAKLATSRTKSFSYLSTREVYGIVMALRTDVTNGYLTTIRELIHAEVFSDFLSNAEYFLDEGHKDPAAVIAGSVLEDHIRQPDRAPLLVPAAS